MPKSLWLLSTCLVALSAPAVAQDSATGLPAAPSATPADSATAAEAVQVAMPTAFVPATVDDDAPGSIIVTATRRASPLSDVPIAVTAISAQSLQNSGATDIRQLNQLAPSLLVSSTGNEANASARIRGIGTVGDNPGLESSVATFIDGVYRSRTGAGLNELGEIERVEVLRGPQGTLFGRNASAGLINIVTRSPSFADEGYAEATYGNYDTKRVSGGLTGPIVPDLLAFRLDGVYVKRDGFYRNVTQDHNDARVNDRDRYLVRGQLLLQPGDDFKLRVIGDYTHRDESCCAAVYQSVRETRDTTPAVPGDFTTSATNRILDILRRQGGVFPSAGNQGNREIAISPGRTYRNTTEDYGASAQIDWKIGPGTLTSITAYREYKAGNASDADFGNVDLLYFADDGQAYRQFHTFTQEARYQGSTFGGKLDYLVGGFYSNETLKLVSNLRFGSQYGTFAACRVLSGLQEPTGIPSAALVDPAAAGCLTPTSTAVIRGGFGALAPAVLRGLNQLGTVNDVGDDDATYRQKSESFAVFTHNIVNITDRLSATIGLRYTHERKDFDADFVNTNTVCPTQQAQIGPLLASPGVPAAAKQFLGGIVTLSCQGNASSGLNSLKLVDTRKEGQWTGTGVLSWKATDRLLTYVSYAKGYKAGGFNLDRSALGSVPGVNAALAPRTAADVGTLQFAAEKVDAYEVGFKFASRRFSLNVAGFRQEFNNFQLNTFNGSVFIVQNVNACKDALNGGDTDASAATGACPAHRSDRPGLISQGVELEAAVYPARGWQFTAGYTHAETRFRRNLVGNSSGVPLDPALFLLSGDTLSNAPANVVTASGSWTPNIGPSGMKGLVYVDTRMSSDYNTGSDLAPEKAQQSFTVVNARIGLHGAENGWALEVWGQNIFDTFYSQVAFNAPFQGANSVAQIQRFGAAQGFGVANQIYASYLAEPRTYGVTVRTRF